MSNRKGVRNKKGQLLATLVTAEKSPCVFCQRQVDDEVTYGKLYAIGDIQCHYFCVLLSCCLIQKGKDEEGLFGFMYPDILAEVERSKKHRCSYCGKGGATLGCCITQCRKQFHLPCGRERNAVSLFYGTYKSYCQQHAPKQKIPDHIMQQARIRSKQTRNTKKLNTPTLDNTKESEHSSGDDKQADSPVCVICYESVEGYPAPQTFWPPCCARDAWFHRSCVQRMALSAGMHYLKCPLCNDKERFYEAVVSQGYYVPDRDAAWELEQNAFAEIYERALSCSAQRCLCPEGRGYDADSGPWDMQLCMLCGTLAAHARCHRDNDGDGSDGSGDGGRLVCAACKPAAPADLPALARRLDELALAEQRVSSAARSRRGPVMPSRMSLRRTKQRNNTPSTSQTDTNKSDISQTDAQTAVSRLELNLKPPRKRPEQKTILRSIQNELLSPSKLLEESLRERMSSAGRDVDVKDVVELMREKFRKPRPLSEKKRVVNDIMEGLFNSHVKENPKTKELAIKWISPRKSRESNDVCKIKTKTPTATASDNTEPSHETATNKFQLPETPDAYSQNIPRREINIISAQENNFNKENSMNGDDIPTEKEIASKEDDIPEKALLQDGDQTEICAEAEQENVDDNSNSTFELPSEFIANHNSDDSVPFDTPKTVDIQKNSSLEISENDEVVNIDVVKMEHCPNKAFIKSVNIKSPAKNKKCAFKFSPIDKEKLDKSNVNIDMESFKSQYLNEVDRAFKCNFNHKHDEHKVDNNPAKLQSVLDFAIDAIFKINKDDNLKRKLPSEDSVPKKRKRKNKKCLLKYNKMDSDIQVVCDKDSIDLTLARKKRKKLKKKQRDNIQVKIKWKKEQLKLKIMKAKSKKAKEVKSPNSLKQYVLKYSPKTSSADKVLVRPDNDVTPKKKKYIKSEKSQDNLVQTSIQNFFKVKPQNTL